MGCCCCRPVPAGKNEEEEPAIEKKDAVLNQVHHDVSTAAPVNLGETNNHNGSTYPPEKKETKEVDTLPQQSGSNTSNKYAPLKSDTLGTNNNEEKPNQHNSTSLNSTAVHDKAKYDSAPDANGFNTESNSEKSGFISAVDENPVKTADDEPLIHESDGKLGTATAQTANISIANVGKSVFNANNNALVEDNVDYSESQSAEERGELSSTLYEQWVRSIRASLKQFCNPEDVRSNYEFSQVVRQAKNLTTQDALILYVLSHPSLKLISKFGDVLVNKYVSLFIEQFDLNRNDTISTKELWDFLFPPEGVRELGLLIKIVREGFIRELNSKKTTISDQSDDFDLFEAMVRMARRTGVFVSPYIGLNFETKSFRAILEALNIITLKEEVDAIVHAIDINLDTRLSSEEVKKFLFPPPHPDYIGAFRGRSSTQAMSKSPSRETTNSTINVHSQNINSVADLFRNSLLAKCENKENKKEQVEQMFKEVDKDGDGHLTILEMKEVLVNFFMSLRAAFIEEVSKEILATILPHLPHNETGLILLRDYQDFLLSQDIRRSPEVHEAQHSVLSTLKLTSLGSESVAHVKETIAAADKDQDGFLSPPEVFQCTQHLFEETQRREVDEDASGMNSLLFEYIDNDKNGTIELNELLTFIWPDESTSSATSESAALRAGDIEGSVNAVRVKILEKFGLLTAADATNDTAIRAAVDGASDDILRARFLSFLESFPANKGYRCMTDDVFLSLALERALACLPMPKLGVTKQLNREEVAHILKQMDRNSDGAVSVEELRAWLKA